MTLGPQLLENGCGDGGFPAGRGSWAVAGQTNDGRLLKVDWVKESPPCRGLGGWCANVASLVRELLYDHAAEQLIMRPVAEYTLLHNATFIDGQTKVLRPDGKLVSLGLPPSVVGAMDMNMSFDLRPALSESTFTFGLAVRAEQNQLSGAGLVLNLSVSAPHPETGTRLLNLTNSANAQIPLIRIMKGELLHVRLLIDKPVIEVFLMGGRAAFVATKVPYDSNATAVHLFNNGARDVIAREISVKGMGCGWAAGIPMPMYNK